MKSTLKQLIRPDQSEAGSSATPAADSERAFASASSDVARSLQPEFGAGKSAMSSTKNILSKDVVLTGKLQFKGDLFLDGRIEGEVTSDGSLTIGENACIEGEVRTRSVTVLGIVRGNITATERAELKSGSQLVGDLTAGVVSIEQGASFIGTSAIGSRPGSPAASSVASTPAPSFSSAARPANEQFSSAAGNACEKRELVSVG